MRISLPQINQRYSGLAESDCCLSCGDAANRADIGCGDVVVDLGSGRGEDVIRIAGQVGSLGHAYGVDAAEGMLQKARRTATKLGVLNCTFVQSPFEDLDLAGDLADWVVSNCAINHAQDKDKTWAEIHRVLKPGGRFMVSDIYSTADVPDEYRNDPVAVAECWAGSVRREVYLHTLQRAGFTDVEIVEESAPYPKGRIEVVSFTISGRKPTRTCCCGGGNC